MAHTHSGEEIDRAVHSTNFTEFTVKKKTEGSLIFLKIGLIAVYIAIVVLIWAFAGLFLGAVSLLAAVLAWWFTWPYVNIEYEYVTSSGEITFTKIYGGGRSRKELMKLKIKDFEKIAPYTSENTAPYSGVQKKYDFRKSVKQTEDVYFAVFTENGHKSMIIFQCTEKALKIFASYNKENTVTVDTLHY